MKKIMVNDVRRAFFYSPVRRTVFVELPEEDIGTGEEDCVGELQMSLYGTRDAAQNWQECCSEHLVELGFHKGVSNPCLFTHL